MIGCTATNRSWNAGPLVEDTSSMLATLSATASSHVLYTPMPDRATAKVEKICDISSSIHLCSPSARDGRAQQAVLVVERLHHQLLAEHVLARGQHLEVDVDVVS